jgi:hypothetical protein
MLSCVILAGTLFLSDGDRLVNFEDVLEFEVLGHGRTLYLDQGYHRESRISIPEELQRDTVIEVLEACIAGARNTGSIGITGS